MSIRDSINTWRWRIVKAGHNLRSFSKMLGIAPSLFSEYCSGKKDPSIERYELIEGKLKELGV